MRRLILILILIGCAKEYKFSFSGEPEEDYKKAMELYEKKEYKKARKVLEEFFNIYPGSKYTDDAQFYLAECYFYNKDYESALMEYNFLLENFPESKHRELAYLRRAVCLEKLSPREERDQEKTMEAISAYEEFITRFPYSKYVKDAEEGIKRLRWKLLHKKLTIAKLYLKWNRPKSSIIYAKSVLNSPHIEDYPDLRKEAEEIIEKAQK